MFKRKIKKAAESQEADVETVKTENDSIFLGLPMYKSCRRSIRDPLKEEIIKLIKDIDLFKGMKDRELKKIYTEFHSREYKKNEYVFKEGSPCGALFIVRSGEISIQRTKTITDKSNRFNMKHYTEVYAKITEGGMFGEMAFLNEDTLRTTDAVCTEPAKTILLFPDSLSNFFKKEPAICQKFLKNVISIQGKSLKDTNHELLEAKLQNKKLIDYINSLQNESSPTIKSVDEIILQDSVTTDRG